MSIFGPSVEKEKKVVQVEDANYPKRTVGFIKPFDLRADVLIGPAHKELPILIEWNSLKGQPRFQFTGGLVTGFTTLYAHCIRGGVATYSFVSEVGVGPDIWYVLSPDLTTLTPEFTLSYVPMRLEFGFCFSSINDALGLKGTILGSLTGGVGHEIVVERLKK